MNATVTQDGMLTYGKAALFEELVDGLTGERLGVTMTLHGVPGVWTFPANDVPIKVFRELGRWVAVNWVQEVNVALGAVAGYRLVVHYDRAGGIERAVFILDDPATESEARAAVTAPADILAEVAAASAADPAAADLTEAAEAAAARDDDAPADARAKASERPVTMTSPDEHGRALPVTPVTLGTGRVHASRYAVLGTMCGAEASSNWALRAAPEGAEITCKRCLKALGH